MSQSILFIDDDSVFVNLVNRHLKQIGYLSSSASSWSEAKEYLRHNEPSLIIIDKKLPDVDGLDVLDELVPDYPVIVLTGFGSVQSAVRAIKNGASDYLSKPIDLDELELTIKRVLTNAQLVRDLEFNRDMVATHTGGLMVGSSPALNKVRNYIDAVSNEEITVLVLGDSGVGKELVARSIHQQSHRAERNFVTVDCCAFSEDLFESELFGHERGAFTSANVQKSGLIEGAQGGTLFLDEIGEVGQAIQAKLLHVLETGTYRRVGGTKELRADVRIVAATNRDLGELCTAGKFRSDLFYRLNGFVITVPPLRERKEDIPELVRHFFEKNAFARRMQTRIGADVIDVLSQYDWPGNVRELKNVIERALILKGDEPMIRTEHLTFINHRPSDNGASRNPKSVQLEFAFEPTLQEIEGRYVGMILDRYDGKRSVTADVLGISERTLYRLLKNRRTGADQYT